MEETHQGGPIASLLSGAGCLALAAMFTFMPDGTSFSAPAWFIGVYVVLGHWPTTGILALLGFVGIGFAIRQWSKELAAGTPAGFWRRLVAAFIDFLIAWVPAAILLSVIAGSALDSAAVSDPSAYAAMEDAMVIVGAILAWIYFAAMESSRWQATLGKRFIGIRVTDARGGRLSFPRAALRFVVKVIGAIPLYLGLLMVAFTKQKRGLHDMLARSLVVNTGR